MGMKSYVLCVGAFGEKVKDCLSYDAEFYEGTEPGVIVITSKLSCNTNDQSRELAEALGCDVWDFNTHYINPEDVNWPALYNMADTCEWNDRLDIGRLDKLIRAKFMCIFMPNG